MASDEIRAAEEIQEQAAGRFYTPVEGMEGIGTPLIPAASVSMTEERPEQVRGGTYSGMQVTREVMEAIKRGNGGSIFYFEENPELPGYYVMHPTYPESGSGDRGGTYKIRENVNLLYKGLASRFVNDRGEIDVRAGREFMDELSMRFQADESNNDPTLSKQEIAAGRMEWLCHELRVPEASQEDFTRFAQSCITNTQPTSDTTVFNYGNFFSLFENWAQSVLAADEALEKTEPEEQALRDAIRPGYERSKQELLELAGIDPVKERRMIMPTECSGSAAANEQLFERAFRGREGGSQAGQFEYSIEREQKHMISRRNELRDELSKMQENPEKEAMALFNAHHQAVAKLWAEEEDPEKKAQLLIQLQDMIRDPEKEGMRLFHQRLAEISEPLADLQNEIDAKSIEDPNMTRKWDYHRATNAASFEIEQPDGTKKTYYITLEAFAPESNVLMDHPPISADVSVGIYESEADFQAYYRQDDAMVRKDDPLAQRVLELKTEDAAAIVKRISQEKKHSPEESLTREVRQQLVQERQRLVQERQNAYFGPDSEWQKGILNEVDDSKRDREMGINIDGADFYSPGFRRLERNARALTSRIPEDIREKYSSLVEALGHLNYQVNDLLMQEMTYDNVWEMQSSRLNDPTLSSQERETTQAMVDALAALSNQTGERNMPMQLARGGAAKILDGIMQGKALSITSQERDDINRQMQPYGLTVDSIEDMARSIKGKLLPVSQVRMDVQEALPGLADDLMQRTDFRSALDSKSMTVDFAVDNFDSAIKGAFLPEEKEVLKAMDMEIYQQITVNGRPVSEILEEKYPDIQVNHDIAKCEIMASACRGEQVEFALGFSDEAGGGKVPLKVTSKIPEIRKAFAEKALRAEMEAEIQAREAEQEIESYEMEDIEMTRMHGVEENVPEEKKAAPAEEKTAPKEEKAALKTRARANSVQQMNFAEFSAEMQSAKPSRERRASEYGKQRESMQRDSVQRDGRQKGNR